MTKRLIRSHKGGRTDRASAPRMTPQEKARLDTVLQQRGVKHTDWYIGHVNADYEAITGGNTMADKIAMQFDEKYVTQKDIISAGGKWHSDGAYYEFKDGSWGRFTDIKNGAQESRLRFIASATPIDKD